MRAPDGRDNDACSRAANDYKKRIQSFVCRTVLIAEALPAAETVIRYAFAQRPRDISAILTGVIDPPRPRYNYRYYYCALPMCIHQ